MGLTVLDSGVLIGLLDGSDAHHRAATAALRAAEERLDALALPAPALAEVLVGPLRRGSDAVSSVNGLLSGLAVTVLPTDEVVARRAAALRAAAGLRLPDALIVATAAVAGADRLLTTDARWSPVVTDHYAGVIELVGG